MGNEEKKPRVLIVDDIEINRELLERRLKKKGFECVTAASGKEALEAYRRNIDVVLLDIMMPDMLGSEVLKEIRKEKSAKELPVIMVSAKDRGNEIDEFLKIGANDYLTKPVDMKDLIEKLGKCKAS